MQTLATQTLEQEIEALAKANGVDKVGFTDRERLADAPPSGDLGFVLPNARSAISLAVHLDMAAARAYLGKEDLYRFNRDHQESYRKLKAAGIAIRQLLESRGHEVALPYANFEYREDPPSLEAKPPLSHRYVAMAAGVGWIGWSGNLLTREFGALVTLGSVVTSADLTPSPRVEEEWCDDCRICVATCPSHFMSKREEDSVPIADSLAVNNKKRAALRCIVSCGGANGVRRANARWSTWSYKVLDLPGPEKSDEEFEERVVELSRDPEHRRALGRMLGFGKTLVHDWDDYDGIVDTMKLTCSTCQLICWPELKDRKKLHRMFVSSGRITRGDPRLKPTPLETGA
ncbi:MAG: hypothetical protein V3V67_10775 [Myxococcota bacterium]